MNHIAGDRCCNEQNKMTRCLWSILLLLLYWCCWRWWCHDMPFCLFLFEFGDFSSVLDHHHPHSKWIQTWRSNIEHERQLLWFYEKSKNLFDCHLNWNNDGPFCKSASPIYEFQSDAEKCTMIDTHTVWLYPIPLLPEGSFRGRWEKKKRSLLGMIWPRSTIWRLFIWNHSAMINVEPISHWFCRSFSFHLNFKLLLLCVDREVLL